MAAPQWGSKTQELFKFFNRRLRRIPKDKKQKIGASIRRNFLNISIDYFKKFTKDKKQKICAPRHRIFLNFSTEDIEEFTKDKTQNQDLFRFFNRRL